MISKLLFALFFVCSFLFNSQVINPVGLDFFEFTSGEYHYKICISFDEIKEKGTQCTVRISYNDSASLVEYYSKMEVDVLTDTNMITVIPTSENVKILKGTNGYNPDTFLLVFDKEGVFLKGESTDKDSSSGNPLKIILPSTASESISLIKQFYSKQDQWYSSYLQMSQQMISSN